LNALSALQSGRQAGRTTIQMVWALVSVSRQGWLRQMLKVGGGSFVWAVHKNKFMQALIILWEATTESELVHGFWPDRCVNTPATWAPSAKIIIRPARDGNSGINARCGRAKSRLRFGLWERSSGPARSATRTGIFRQHSVRNAGVKRLCDIRGSLSRPPKATWPAARCVEAGARRIAGSRDGACQNRDGRSRGPG